MGASIRAARRLACARAIVLGLACAAALPAAAQVSTGTNGIYDVAVDAGGDYTARTGPGHPGPNGVNLFYNGSALAPGTTWNTVRSYRSNDEWVLQDFFLFGPTASPGFTCDSIDNVDTPTVTALVDGGGRQTGVRSEWSINNGTDNLLIRQEVNAEGTTFADSVVRVTVCVRNRGAVDARIGIRFQWDWEIGANDGPFMGVRPPYPPVEPLLRLEQDFPNPTFDFYDMSDTRRPSINPPLYIVGGTVNRPLLAMGPTPPELLQYAYWPGISQECFDYTTAAAVAGSVDSSVGYYWGATSGSAVVIPPAQNWCATQYVFVFTDVPPPLCQVQPSLTGGVQCDASVPLDASASTATDCAGALEYQFLDPTGAVAEAWSTDPFHAADSAGNWTVEVRCSTDPACRVAATAPVAIERPPLVNVLDAVDVAACNLGVRLSWDVTFRNSTFGTYSVYRSETSCAHARTQPAIAQGLSARTFSDATTRDGASYYYVIEAEDSAPNTTCVPQGPLNRGAVATRCIGPVTDRWAPSRPAGMCWPLRISHAVDDLVLDWSGSRALLSDEHFHVMKAVDDPRSTFILATTEGYLGVSHSETDPSGIIQFFDVRVADACEAISADDEPPGYDVPSAICP